MFEINGVELEYDAFDLDTAERFQQGKKTVAETIGKLEGADGIAVARGQCRAVKEFFDTMFGDGAGIKICGKKDNLRVCADAYAAMLQEDVRQGQEYMDGNPMLGLTGKRE